MLLSDLSTRAGLPAIRIGSESLSYGALERAARSYASALLRDGVRPGDRVAVWATPDLATVVAMVGNALSGIVTVPLNPALGTGELAHILSDAGPRRILAARPSLFSAKAPTDAIPGGNDGPLPSPPGPEDPLLVLYTSGTTGAPKGAILTHGNAASNLDALAQSWAWMAEDRLLHALPLFHVHGLVLGCFGALRVGSSVEILGKFSPEAICGAFDEGRSTMLFGVPTMYHRIAEALEAEPSRAKGLSRARLLVSGSAALPVREHQRLASLLGQGIVERYGLTETLINCSMTSDGDRRHGTVGLPLPGIELRLVEEGEEVREPGQIGEVAVRGPNVFAGYLGLEDATARAFDAEGFFLTGDLATRDPDGFVRIVGRKATDLIKTGGYKVGAGEVEAALLAHPAVREAAVVGRPDDDLGERIVAYVVPREGAAPSHEALTDHVASLLAPHKRPRETRFVGALPRNAMGKVLKRDLGG